MLRKAHNFLFYGCFANKCELSFIYSNFLWSFRFFRSFRVYKCSDLKCEFESFHYFWNIVDSNEENKCIFQKIWSTMETTEIATKSESSFSENAQQFSSSTNGTVESFSSQKTVAQSFESSVQQGWAINYFISLVKYYFQLISEAWRKPFSSNPSLHLQLCW